MPRGPNKKPLTEEQRQRLRDNLARGRETAKQNRALGIVKEKAAAAASSVDIDSLVASAVAKALANLPAAPAAPSSPDDRLRQLTEALALSIGDLTNQNSGQKLIKPEVLAARREAERKMHMRIAKACELVAAGDANAMPHYRLKAKIIAPLMNGDELIEPLRRGSDNIVRPVEMDWPLPPNLAMEPINDPAREIFALFKESIGNQSNVRVVGVDNDGTAKFAAESDRYFLTNQGHAVTAGSSTMAMRNAGDAEEALVRVGAAIRGQDPARVNNGPPTMQVRVLGTIAAPAVQNG